MILLGIPASGYLENVSIQIGSGFLLVAPLIFVERIIGRRLDAARDETKVAIDRTESRLGGEIGEVRAVAEETRSRIRILASETHDRLDEARAADSALLADFQRSPSWDSTRRLLARADQLDGISRYGVRVRLPGTSLRLVFPGSPTFLGEPEPQLLLRVEDVGGAERFRFSWRGTQSTIDLLLQLVRELQRRDLYPGESAFDPEAILGGLGEAISTVLAVRTHRHPHVRHLCRVIELVEQEWAVTTCGLENVRAERRMSWGEIRTDRPRAGNADEVDPGAGPIAEALTVARAILDGGRYSDDDESGSVPY